MGTSDNYFWGGENKISPSKRYLFTDYAETESYFSQLQNPGKASGRKPPPGAYFETLTFEEEKRAKKLAKEAVAATPLDAHRTTGLTAQVLRNNNMRPEQRRSQSRGDGSESFSPSKSPDKAAMRPATRG